MAFTLMIDKHPEALKVLKNIQAERLERGKEISQHGAVIYAINQYENYRRLIDDKNVIIKQMESELSRLRELTKTTGHLKNLLNQIPTP